MNKTTQENQLIIYETEDGKIRIDAQFEDENVWLTQKLISKFYNVDIRTVNEHLKNIFSEKELDTNSVIRNFRITAVDGKSYNTKHYNLDAILAVGYHVRSDIGTLFRQWAIERIKEYIVKGFSIDDARLKEIGGGGYWKELLARIRDIRASEKVFYRQILDIYATSIDYNPKADRSVEFFKKVQNKAHYAVHGQTAPEVIYNRADAEKELRALGQIVSGYLDFAERQAEREVPMKMKDWAEHLDAILTSTGEKLLLDAGKISHEKAIDKAKTEYKKYQAKALSEVEKSYLNNIKSLQKKVARSRKK